MWRKRMGAGTLAIPHPLDVDALIGTVRKGCLATQAQLRARLARKYRVDHACPLTTGIFVRIAAEAAEEDCRAGRKAVMLSGIRQGKAGDALCAAVGQDGELLAQHFPVMPGDSNELSNELRFLD
jgi:hypothetical protein